MLEQTQGRSLVLLVLCLTTLGAKAAPVEYSGALSHIIVNDSSGIYGTTPLGTIFTLAFDDVTFIGDISAGGLTTALGPPTIADGLTVSNNSVLDTGTADFLNSIAGAILFSPGDEVDGVDLETDVAVAGGGRLEAGVSFVFAPDTFADTDPSNYPFDPANVLVSLIFIIEENVGGTDIYEGYAKLSTVPLPAAGWLLLTGIASIAGWNRRSTSR